MSFLAETARVHALQARQAQARKAQARAGLRYSFLLPGGFVYLLVRCLGRFLFPFFLLVFAVFSDILGMLVYFST